MARWTRLGAGVIGVAFILVGIDLGCGVEPAVVPPDDTAEAGDADASVMTDGALNGDAAIRKYACPSPSGSFPAGTDKWSPLTKLRHVPTDDDPGAWIPPIHIMLLADGRILTSGANMRDVEGAGPIMGTSNFLITPGPDPVTDVEIYPQEVTSHGRNVDDSLFCAGHAQLEDGRIFVAGGNGEGFYCDAGPEVDGGCVEANLGLDSAQIFDPKTNTYTLLDPPMKGGKRWYPTVTRMPDGQMLVTAGDAVAEFEKNHSVEVYDPKANTFTLLSDEAHTPKDVEIVAHYVHVYWLPRPISAQGRTRESLIMGERGDMFLFSAETAFSGTMDARWVRTTPRPWPTSGPDLNKAHGASGIMLPILPRNGGPYNAGSVLVVGGSEDPMLEEQANVYDPYIDQWCSLTAPLGIPRFQPSTVALPDGNILLMAGGPFPTDYFEDLPQRAPQILDPRTGAVFKGSAWPDKLTRGYHNTLVLLPDARVIVAGGRTFAGGDADLTGNWDERPDFRYYYPPYFTPIFAGKPRPSLDKVPGPMPYAAPFEVQYSKGPIDAVAIVGLGSQTHCVDMNTRHVTLDFTGGTGPSGEITITGPLDKDTAPPGPYMLFLLHKIDGWLVPSVAKILQVQ